MRFDLKGIIIVFFSLVALFLVYYFVVNKNTSERVIELKFNDTKDSVPFYPCEDEKCA
jgi:regulatory protein YycI of two-component signal transduction system YycFG